MGQAIGDIIPLAIGIAISPVSIIAIILMLITPKARSNGLAFLIGWAGGLLVVGAIVLIVEGNVGFSTGSDQSKATGLIRLVLGILLLALAGKRWRERPKAGEEASLPKWMGALDTITPVRALGLAALLSGVNPKNLALNVSACSSIALSGLSATKQVIVLIVTVVIASLGALAPLIVYFAMGARSEKLLGEWKSWLAHNNATVMFVLLLVFGFVLVGKGITGLS